MKSILAAIAMATATLTASAAPVTLTLDGYQYGSAPEGTMTVNKPGLFNNQSTTIAVSGLNATVNGFDSYLLWCIEIFAPTENFGVGANYNQNTPGLRADGLAFSTAQQSRLEKLFAKQLESDFVVGGSTATSSAGTQLAIWEILYDTTAGFGDLTGNLFEQAGLLDTNGFWSTGLAGARGYAENLLSGLDSYDATSWKQNWEFTSFNNGGSKAGLQDFLTVTQKFGDSCTLQPDLPECNPNTVPEPDSLALMGASLFGLGLVTRRRQAKRDAERQAQLIV